MKEFINVYSFNLVLSLIYSFVILIMLTYVCSWILSMLTSVNSRRFFCLTEYKYWFIKLRSYYIPIFLTLTMLFIIVFFLFNFNDGGLWVKEFSPKFKDIGAWADLATFFTVPLAIISIFYVYRAFRSQTLAARRSSFDATFTQIFAQHSILREKVIRHNISLNMPVDMFTMFRVYVVTNKNDSVFKCYEDFVDLYDLHGAVDFKNFFKYIFHEVCIIARSEVLDEASKERYIELIQGQMNNDELFCYLINQIDIIRKRPNSDRVNRYARCLKDYNFFKDLCHDDKYSTYIKDFKNRKNGATVELSRLIRDEWIE